MSQMPEIPFGRPMIGAEEKEAVMRVLNGPQLVHGPVAAEFEASFAARAQVEFAITVSSCTAGLYLALLSSGIGSGDEVIVPAMTHVATAHAVELLGAKPVFADVSPATGNIEPNNIAKGITGRTRAIIVVHYLGLPCEMTTIRPMAAQADALLIEDAALAVDASYDGVKVGGLADIASFSFYPVKHMTSAEGGMVTTNNAELADAVRRRRSFGYDKALGERSKPGIYDVNVLGNNLRMSDVHAAIGLEQLKKLDGIQRARAENHARIAEGLRDLDKVTIFPAAHGKARSSHYCLNIVLPVDGSINRDAVVARLKAAGIGTSVHYPSAVPLFTYYSEKYGYRRGEFETAEWIAAQAISLPVGPHLPPDGPDRIIASVKTAVQDARKVA